MGIIEIKEERRLRLTPDRRFHEMSETPSTGKAEPRPVELGELFAAYHQRVSVWVRRLGGPQIEVDDAVQEVFLLAYRHLGKLKQRDGLKVWLYRATENVVRHQRRRLRRQREVLSGGAETAQLASESPSPGELATDEEARRKALQLTYAVLDRMSERNRTLIILFELEELTGQEIAELKGAKVATVWVWLHRARAEFRRHLAALTRITPQPLSLKR